MYTNKNHYDKDNYNEILYSGIVGHIFKHQHTILSPNYLLDKKKVLEIGPGFSLI